MIRLDTPAGLVEARVEVSRRAPPAPTLRNVPAFPERRDAIVELPAGPLVYDLAFGGNFYAIADAAAAGVEVDPEQAPALVEAGADVMAAIEDQDRRPPGRPPHAGCAT